MNREDIIKMAREAGLHVANDSEGHFSGVTNEEIIDMYPDKNKERDRLFREKIFTEVLTPFAKLVEAYVRGEIFRPDWDNYRQGLIDGATAERKACLEICENYADIDSGPDGIIQDYHAYLIQARGQQ